MIQRISTIKQRLRGVPINPEPRRVLEAWWLSKKDEGVFYNPQIGKPFVDLKTGFALACPSSLTKICRSAHRIQSLRGSSINRAPPLSLCRVVRPECAIAAGAAVRLLVAVLTRHL